MLNKILLYCFYLLFLLTPLIFTKYNNELFEYNKMMFVYLLTVLSVGTFILKQISEKKFVIKRTPLDIPLLLFLGSQMLSTIFSIDPHTSVWGYYSRSNGGLLSIISYILLYYVFVSSFEKKDIFRFLKVLLFGGLIVSLYAIPEHFGVSPSCVILTGNFSADCWVQDVQARVFATLGQPNWLAAYLGMIIFPAIYFFIISKTRESKIYYFLQIILFYLAFTFTYTRGATLGILGGLLVFVLALVAQHAVTLSKAKGMSLISFTAFRMTLTILICFALINILFGSALTGDFRLIKSYAPARPAITGGGSTQLETGGTESGQIRLIVWKGALEIFKHYPILGSGVETFAYSYYNFRPVEHNYVSEWDFLYNKAHNEYLNYLATTGALGIITYLGFIGFFIYWSLKKIFAKKIETNSKLFLITILGGYTSYLIQNFFLFSVVMIAVLFYLFPGFSFIETGEIKEKEIKFLNFLFKRDFYSKFLKVGVVLIMLVFIFRLGLLWEADTLFKKGSDYSDAGNAGRAYNLLISAVKINTGEPLYLSELGYAAGSAALALESDDATQSAQLKDDAAFYTDAALSISPKNVSLYRTAIRTYYSLYLLDPKLEGRLEEVLNKTAELAPTDPKVYYNKGLVLYQMGKKAEALTALKKAIELKTDYQEAKTTYEQISTESAKTTP